MYFLNTEMHMVTFAITVVELVMLVLQIIHFLQRPSDNKRLQYLILLILLIVHNIVAGLFPDKNIPIPVGTQTIAAYFVGFLMSIYAVYYFYKVFELHSLKFYATYGALLFLLLPFLALFVVPYLLTGNTFLSSRMAVIIPFFYGLGYIYQTARSFIQKFRVQRKEGKEVDKTLYHNAIAAYVFAVCWASLPLVVFFGNFQVLAHSVTNAGFLVMTVVYVRSNIIQSRQEYEKLLRSEHELKQMNRVLKKKVKRRTEKLEATLESRRTTMINLAHETKTPLTLINNYLSEHIDKHGETQEIKVIRNNMKRLTNDIVNLFDVESYERGFSIYNNDQVSNFTSLLNDKVELFRLAAQKRGIGLRAHVDKQLYVRAHPGAVDRIVNNLLENAIKYSDRGSAIETGLFQDGQQFVTFYVSDSGRGIPEDQREKVFEPYYKLSVGGKNSDGMGMGLSIVKRIIADLNGSIELTSEVDRGTEIRISLPRENDPTEVVQEGVSSSDIDFAYNQILLEENLDGDKPFVILVEDNIEMLNFLQSKLKAKYNIAVARNGKEAIERLNSLSSVDLIISDIMMDEMDGYELCKEISTFERYAHIPFVFLSAKGTSEDRLAGLNLGAVTYIQKPFEIDELVARVDSILSNLKRHREAFVNKAYKATMSDLHNLDQAVTGKRCDFTDNCKKHHLTFREVEIVKLLINGSPYKVISADLSISEKTVSKHVSNIFSKVGVNSKIELISRLEAQNLIVSSRSGVRK